MHKPEITEDRRGWQFQKSVSLGNVMTGLILLGTLATAWNSMDRRISVLEAQQTQQLQVNQEIRDNLIRLNNKLDRWMEYAYQRQFGNRRDAP